jgi:hypothetical protein
MLFRQLHTRSRGVSKTILKVYGMIVFGAAVVFLSILAIVAFSKLIGDLVANYKWTAHLLGSIFIQ